MNSFFDNILIVSGTGQNVGKTPFVCKLIEKFKIQQIIALKISPFWHNINNKDDVIIKNESFSFIERKQ